MGAFVPGRLNLTLLMSEKFVQKIEPRQNQSWRDPRRQINFFGKLKNSCLMERVCRWPGEEISLLPKIYLGRFLKNEIFRYDLEFIGTRNLKEINFGQMS